MAGTITGWVTINGSHIPLIDGESKESATKKYINKQNGKTKSSKKASEKVVKESKKEIDERQTLERYKTIQKEYIKINNEYMDKITPSNLSQLVKERDIKLNEFIKDNFNPKTDTEYQKYKDMLARTTKIQGSMPIEASYEISKWKTVSKSPYSSSYYNADGITWGYKPEGSIRISDHWNFESQGDTHCKLKGVTKYQSNRWIMAEYHNGEYIILKEFKNGE